MMPSDIDSIYMQAAKLFKAVERELATDKQRELDYLLATAKELERDESIPEKARAVIAAMRRHIENGDDKL